MSILIIKLMDKVSTLGPMGKFTKVNGNKALNTAMVFGRAKKVTAILVNGIMVRWKDMVYIRGLMAIDMKDYGKTQLKMVKALIYLLMETCTKESIKMGNQMAKVYINGGMELVTLVILLMVKSKV